MAFAKGGRTRLAFAALSLVAALGCATGALAAPLRAFDGPAQPLSRALLDFAVQANISIGLDAAAGCRQTSHALKGRYTVSGALNHLLADSGCGYRLVDGDAVTIVRAAPTATPSIRRRVITPPREDPTAVISTVPEVVVTATRRGALTMGLPDSIGVISGARLAETRETGIADLAGQTPGLTVTNLGPGSDKAIIRGLSDGGLTGHGQSTVGIYLDDTRLTYNAPDPDLRLTDVDRVEVLQGPQGALYGSGSIAGVVHVVTRQPDLDQFSGEVTVSGSGTEHGLPSNAIEGVVNVPVAPGQLGLRAVAWREHDGGYIDDVALGRDGTNSTDRTGFRLTSTLNVGGDWSIELGIVGQTLKSADSQYSSAHYGAYQRGVLAQEPHSNDFDEIHLTVQGEVGLGAVKNTLSLVGHTIDTRYSAGVALPVFAPAVTAGRRRL